MTDTFDTPIAAGTVITADYLPWVRVAARSFLEHNPDAKVEILFADHVPHDKLRADEPFTAVAITDVGLTPDAITWLNLIYNPLELSCALKPLLIRKMLNSAKSVLYIDADMRIYGSLAEVGELATEHGLLLSPHALAPRITPSVEDEEVLMRMGQFNAGFLAVGQNGRAFLNWWWSKLARECHDIRRALPQRFLDQLWLDNAVGYFPHVVHRDVGTNVARWNLFQRNLQIDGDRYVVNGEPLRLFHFSAFDPATPWLLRPDEFDHPSLDPARSPVLAKLLTDYTAELVAAGWTPRVGEKPILSHDGISLTPVVRHAISAALMQAERMRAAPTNISSDPYIFRAWLRGPVTPDGLTWYLYGLHGSEPRVRSAFPNVPGSDEIRYVAWAMSEGASQGFVPPVIALSSNDDLRPSNAAPGQTAADAPPAPASEAGATPDSADGSERDDAGPTAANQAPAAPRVQPSAALLRFTAECANERNSILELALAAASEIPDGSRLLDVGAGNSPYRELFTNLVYESNDWQHSMHPGARAVDHIGPAHAIPVGDGEYDAVLCTQVLEHVPNPQDVLNEIQRVLKEGGRLYMTVPLAWELHELPFDFFRHTPSGLATILTQAGFKDLDIRARNDSFSTIAQLLRNLPTMIGPYPDGKDQERGEVRSVMHGLADRIEGLHGLDSRWIFPLGYAIRATKTTAGERSAITPAPVERGALRDACGLSRARGFVTVCFASDLLADPRLLSGYASHFTGADDATLAVYAPDVDVNLAGQALVKLVQNLGLDGANSPDMIALPHTKRADETALAAAADAVLALRPPWGAFAGLPWAHAGTLAEIHTAAIKRPAIS
jgi:SAM-dependent methyltransferase